MSGLSEEAFAQKKKVYQTLHRLLGCIKNNVIYPEFKAWSSPEGEYLHELLRGTCRLYSSIEAVTL